MLPLPEVWFCCLHPIEGGMTELVAASALPVFPFIQEDIYRALWTVSGGTLDDARFEAYVSLFTVGLVELEIEGELLDFYQLDIIDLTRWQVFIASGGLACDDGCYISPAYAKA
jgi:hypothetical protein